MNGPEQLLKILVVDDDKLIRVSTTRQLRAAGFAAAAAESPFAALAELQEGSWDAVLTDLRMPGMDGLEFLKQIKERYPHIEVLLMTAFGTVGNAVEAMRNGAADFLTKPFPFEELQLRLERIADLKRTRAELLRLRKLVDQEKGRPHGLVGESAAMKAVAERINTFAGHDVPVLITGETGTGKEVVARALHGAGARADGPFVAVGCGTIPRDLAESELFGHEKGSFTGATNLSVGSFERADGGTLLLDDIDDLPLEIQVKLLRVLQEGTVSRVGSSKEFPVDVRVLATSKVDLEQAVKEGAFRPDLFYRLRGLEIHLPPLRERGDDVLLLAQHFLQLASLTDGVPTRRLDASAARLLRQYSWPGNVRELRRAMESAHVLCGPSGTVDAAALPDFLHRSPASSSLMELHLAGRDQVDFAGVVRDLEVKLLRWALERAGGRQAEAAKLLSMPRTTFQSRLAALGLAKA